MFKIILIVIVIGQCTADLLRDRSVPNAPEQSMQVQEWLQHYQGLLGSFAEPEGQERQLMSRKSDSTSFLGSLIGSLLPSFAGSSQTELVRKQPEPRRKKHVKQPEAFSYVIRNQGNIQIWYDKGDDAIRLCLTILQKKIT